MQQSKIDNAKFFGYSVERRQSLPEDMQLLIIYAISDKESVLNNLYKLTLYLPKNLQIELIKKEILKTNNELFLLSERNNFSRIIFDIENPENFSMYAKFMDNDFLDCFDILNDTEYLQYLNYSESETDLNTLPKFDLITDYLALIEYYDYLMICFNAVEAGGEIPAPKSNYQLQTKLIDDTQRGKLFDLLLNNNYIAPTTDKESFIWAFGGEQPQPNNWQPIEWVDRSITRKEPNIQTLFELLYLLGVDTDTSANNPNNLYRKMEFCFSGFKNIAAKNPYSIQQNTDRQRLLKSIIEEVKKVEAQK